MSNPVRISRYTYDFASSKERLIFTRRPWWMRALSAARKWVLPAVAAALALYVASRPAPIAEPVEPASAKGTDKHGYYEFRRQSGDIREFTFKLTERL